MSLSTKILLSLLAGMAAGAFAWSLFLPGSPLCLVPGAPPLLVAAVFGALLGLVLGLVEAWAADARREKRLAAGLGTACGLAGALLGAAVDAPLSRALARSLHGLSLDGLHSEAGLAAAVGWGVLGLTLGGGLGAARRSARLAWDAAGGGLVGGLVGGVALALLPAQWDTQAPWQALLGPAALGGLIGLGTAAAPWLGRRSWVRIAPGRREHLLARLVTTIGESADCDIRLRGDARVAPTHAVIEAMPGGRHHLVVTTPAGAYVAPVLVNTRPVIGEQWLGDRDRISIGTHTLVFHERASQGTFSLGPAQPQAWKRVLRPRPQQGARRAFVSERPAPGIGSVAPSLPPVPPPPVPEPLPLLGLSRDTAALSLDEPQHAAPVALSALPALLQGIVLRAEQGPYVGRAFVAEASGVTQIGRALEREIPLPLDKAVSRLHARLVPRGDEYFIEDAGSANGTFVNGLRLTSRRALRPGDLIQVGATVLRYA